MKRCARCKTEKPLFDFGVQNCRKDGKNPWCKTCQRAAQKRSESMPGKALERKNYQAAYYLERPWKRDEYRLYARSERGIAVKKKRSLMRKYGISVSDYERMVKNQLGSCACCKTSLATKGHEAHVDHCHATGKVRGILCRWCNLALGHAKDNEAILLSLVEYLRRSRQ